MLPFVAPPRGAHALLLALLNLVLLLLVVLLMSGCATRAPQVRVSPPVHESTMAPTTIADRAFVVVRAEGAAYALTEPSAAHAPSSDEARVLFRAAAIPTTFVVVGPAGQCRAESRER